MKRLIFHIITLLLLVPSCVTPGEIEVFRDRTWAVFGLVGEDKAPVIFVYSLSDEGGYIYNSDAEIVFEDRNSGSIITLVPVIAQDEAFLGTREFPFDQDWAGDIYYYSTPAGMLLPASDYAVHLKIDDEIGIAEISFPEEEPFANVEIKEQVNQNGNTVHKLRMELNTPQTDQLVKWEIAIDQSLDILTPVTYDSVTGDPIEYDTLVFPFDVEITPNNYITREKVEEQEGVFTYNLTNNLPAYENNQDPYLMNVRLRNYSDDLVNYFESVTIQQNGSVFDPFVEPNIIDSNIDGLFGVIGTYSYSQDYILEYLR